MIEMNNDFAIVILSYDGYSDLWESFFKCLETFWNESTEIKKYLVTNTKTYNFENLEVIQTGEEKTWSEKVFRALEKITEPNILVFLEDYFIGDKVDNNEINEAYKFFNSNKLSYLRIKNTPKSKRGKSFNRINTKQRYGVNLQLSFWNKEVLSNILNNKKISAWEFEKIHNDESLIDNKDLFYSSKKDLINIQNGVIKGLWYPQTIKYFLKKHIDIKNGSTRKIMNTREYKKYRNRDILSKIIPDWVIKIVKPILKKIGFKFTT